MANTKAFAFRYYLLKIIITVFSNNCSIVFLDAYRDNDKTATINYYEKQNLFNVTLNEACSILPSNKQE